MKHRSTYGSSYPKLATESTPYSATDSDFLQASFQGQVWDAKYENDLHFNFQGHLKGQIQIRRSEHQILSQNYGSTRTEMISSDSLPPWIVYITMTFDLALDLQGQIQGQRRGNGYRSDITSARVPRWSQTIASGLPGHRAVYTTMTFDRALYLRGQIQRKGYRILPQNYVSTCTKIVLDVS